MLSTMSDREVNTCPVGQCVHVPASCPPSSVPVLRHAQTQGQRVRMWTDTHYIYCNRILCSTFSCFKTPPSPSSADESSTDGGLNSENK